MESTRVRVLKGFIYLRLVLSMAIADRNVEGEGSTPEAGMHGAFLLLHVLFAAVTVRQLAMGIIRV